jgi:hypothetical protein
MLLTDMLEPWIIDVGPGVADRFPVVDDMFQGRRDPAEPGCCVRPDVGVPELGGPVPAPTLMLRSRC